jgi:hypothetical protein
VYSDRWSGRLRQGDILGPIAFPNLGVDFSVSFRSRSLVTPTDQPDKLTITMPAEDTLVTVISHDCEFNEGKRNKLLVAKLQPVPRNLSLDEREALRQSNDVVARIKAKLTVAGVDSFLFAPLDGVFDEEQVANFGTITPLPMKMAEELRSMKRAELDPDARVLFRFKLAHFVARETEVIDDPEKRDLPPTTTVE